MQRKIKKQKKALDFVFPLCYNIQAVWDIVRPDEGFVKKYFSKGSPFEMEENKMSTTLAKKETVQRKWYVLDAAGKPLGRTAVIAANLLRGKHKTDFTPNVDCGDFVIIINTDQAVLTGKKAEQKVYYRHSGWIGGLKETKARIMMEKRSDYAMELAVKGMLPKNTLGRTAMTRLKLFKGAEHIHAAQKPEAWTQE